MTVGSAGAGSTEPGRPPDLLFCRTCGESIARREFLAGRALLLEGTAFCARCAPGAVRRRRALRWATVAVVLAATGTVSAFGIWAMTSVSLRSEETDRVAREALRTAGEASDRRAALEARVVALEARADGVAMPVESTGRAVAALREEERTGLESLEDRLEGVERSLSIVQEGVEGLRTGLAALLGPDALTGEEEREIAARLDDPNPGVRFSALFALRRGKGEAARRAAVRGLRDPQDSVRYEAAGLARALGAEEAVPALVDCLEDGSSIVREAAIAALRALEETDLGFDPLGTAESRAGAVARWRERLDSR